MPPKPKNTGARGCTMINSTAVAVNSDTMEITSGSTGEGSNSSKQAQHSRKRPSKEPLHGDQGADVYDEDNVGADNCYMENSTALGENKKYLKITQGPSKMAADPANVKRNAFISDNSVALLLRGWGNNADQDKKLITTMNAMKDLLVKQADMRGENIVQVETKNEKNGTTRRELWDAIDGIKERLNGANFLFYFIGHNNKRKGGILLQNPEGRDNVLKYDDLKEALRELQSPYKLFILDTCYSSGVTLRPDEGEEEEEEDEEHLAPPLWDNDDGEAVKIQWNSARADQQAFINKGFSWAINEVISNPACQNLRCLELRKDVPRGSLARIEELNTCVFEHLKSKQETGFKINKPDRLADFPAFCRLKY